MRAQGSNGARPSKTADRELWRRSQGAEAMRGDTEYLLDLAAFADSRLDEDDTARIAVLLAGDADAAADVGMARALAEVAMVADEGVVTRATALVDDAPEGARVIAFPRRQAATPPWYSAATWGGLAAAMLVAGWLGFNLGSGVANAPPFGHAGDDVSAGDLLGPTPLMLRDFAENS